MKFNEGNSVITPMGRGVILRGFLDLKFDRYYYFVDVEKSELLKRVTGSKYETKRFWEYELKKVNL